MSRLAGREIALPLSSGEKGPLLRPEAAGLEFPPGPESRGEHADFILDANGESWEFTAWGLGAEALFAPPEGLNREDIPAELKPVFLALALEPLLDRASRALGHAFRPAWPPPAAPGGKEHFILPFTITDSAGKPAGAGRARIPLSAAALSVLADLAKAFPRRPPADCSALYVSLSLCAAREPFPMKILCQAEPGDVLRFSSPPEPALTLEANGLPLWTASLSDGKIAILGVLNKTKNPPEAAMSDTPENAGAPPAEGLSRENLEALEIILTLELDERRISLGELAALGPGQILDTTASLDAPITIKAGGRAVGRGRLVGVGDSLGVLITALELEPRNPERFTV